jgi:hypothetical protein
MKLSNALKQIPRCVNEIAKVHVYPDEHLAGDAAHQ